MVQKKGIVSNMGKGAIYLIVFLLGVICLLPLLNIVAVSFSGSAAVAANRVGIFPVDFTVAAYEKILGDHQFWRSFGISVARVVLALLLNLILIMLMDDSDLYCDKESWVAEYNLGTDTSGSSPYIQCNHGNELFYGSAKSIGGGSSDRWSYTTSGTYKSVFALLETSDCDDCFI